MSRLKTISPDQATGRVKELFDGPFKGLEKNIFKAMANSPAALEAYLGLSKALAGGMLTPGEREAIALAIGEANNCEYCVSAHTFIGIKSGLSEAQTVSARRGNVGDNPRLDALVKFVLKLDEKRGWVTDEDLAKMRATGFNDGHIAEAVACYALQVYTNFFNHVNGTVSDFPPAPVLK